MPKARLELDTVKDLNSFGRKTDVLGVKVSMHVANPALARAPRQKPAVRLDKIAAEIIHDSEIFRIDPFTDKAFDIGEIIAPLLSDDLWIRLRVDPFCELRFGVKFRQLFR